MLHRAISYCVGFAFLLTPGPYRAAADDKPAVPKQVRDLVGTYVGAWTLYGQGAQGAMVKRFAWSDTLKVANPQVKGDRAFVSWIDERVFEGGKIPPNQVEGREGYFLKKDGTLADYFIDTLGQ